MDKDFQFDKTGLSDLDARESKFIRRNNPIDLIQTLSNSSEIPFKDRNNPQHHDRNKLVQSMQNRRSK